MINKLQFDEFQRAIGISKNDTFSLLLGAGCSINSDIPSAEDCIWEWKRDIYKTNNSSSFGWIDNYKNPKTQEIIQNWLKIKVYIPKEGVKKNILFMHISAILSMNIDDNIFKKFVRAKNRLLVTN